jgi:hypothetical protein
VKRLYKLVVFVEVDDRSLDKLMVAAKKIVSGGDPDAAADEIVEFPGDAVDMIAVARMVRGRPQLTWVKTEIDAYGVPIPSKKEYAKLGMPLWEQYHARFLKEHPPILDEDGRHTGEFEGYPTRSK